VPTKSPGGDGWGVKRGERGGPAFRHHARPSHPPASIHELNASDTCHAHCTSPLGPRAALVWPRN
jgi:hypothetical protein